MAVDLQAVWDSLVGFGLVSTIPAGCARDGHMGWVVGGTAPCISTPNVKLCLGLEIWEATQQKCNTHETSSPCRIHI